jgi:hypothetical protein
MAKPSRDQLHIDRMARARRLTAEADANSDESNRLYTEARRLRDQTVADLAAAEGISLEVARVRVDVALGDDAVDALARPLHRGGARRGSK